VARANEKEIEVLSGWNLELGRIQHGHGNDEWHDMAEVTSDSAESDRERNWKDGRIFRCTTCEDEIRVVSPDESGGR
jgi:hypothetical protein